MNFYDENILKSYQKSALNIIIKDFYDYLKHETKERRFVVSPTGSGKTFMMYAFIEKIVDLDKNDDFRFVLITHSLQMAKGFKEDIQKLGTSIYTFEDLENKVSRVNDQVILLNPEKINTDSGQDYLNRWKRANKDKKVILLMDEADVTHDGKRNRDLLDIIKPKYELGFTATFDYKKDNKNAIKSDRKPSVVIHEVPLSDVKKDEVVVKGFESIIDTEGVSIRSIIRAALEKQNEIYDKTKEYSDSYIPRLLIQTNAHKSLDVKDIVLEEAYKINSKLYSTGELNVAGVLTSEIKEFNEEEKYNFLVIIGDGIISRGWDYPEIKIIIAEKNSVDASVGSQLLGRASRMPNHFYRQNDLLNNGYVYVVGKHSIEKSGELYSSGIIVDKSNSTEHNISEKEELLPRGLKQPDFKNWINDFEDNFIYDQEEQYEELIEDLLALMQDVISQAKEKDTHKKQIKRFDFENESEHLGLIDLEIDSNYAMESVKKFLYRKLPKDLVQDTFSEPKLIENVNYKKIYESIIQTLEKDNNKYLLKLMHRIAYKSFIFKFNKRSIDQKKATKYSRSLYDFDDSMNDEEKDFAATLNEYCENNNKYWIRNREKIDIRLPLGYYPDFIVFDENSYFMVEYKGKHLVENSDSLRKKEYGLNNENVKVLMVIKDKKPRVFRVYRFKNQYNSKIILIK